MQLYHPLTVGVIIGPVLPIKLDLKKLEAQLSGKKALREACCRIATLLLQQ
jgi:hypothetical protein